MGKSSRHPVAVAAGLIVAGLAALFVASWVFDADFSNAGPNTDWFKVLTVVCALGAIVVLALRHRPVRRLEWGFAAAAFAVTTLAVVGFISQYNSGYPGQRTLLTAVGGLAVTVGAVLLCLAAPGRWRLPAVASGLFGVVALLLVPVVAWPLLTVTPEWRLAVKTAPAGEAPAVPDMVGKVGWSTEVDGEIRAVLAGGKGAVVMVQDGLIGVDGRTGETLWSRRRTGSYARQVDVSPDGRTAVLQIAANHGNQVQQEVLDAFTGELRWSAERAPDSSLWENNDHVQMTNVSSIDYNRGQRVYSGYSLTDGRKLWDYPVPGGCQVFRSNYDQYLRADAVLLPMSCGEHEFRYVSVDGATGTQRWQHVVGFQEEFEQHNFLLEASPDRDLVTFWFQIPKGPSRRETLDAATGKVVSDLSVELLDHGLGVYWPESRPATLIDVRSGRLIASDPAMVNCARAHKTVALKAGLVCHNTDGMQRLLELRRDGTIELGAARFGESSVTPILVRLREPLAAAADGDEFASTGEAVHLLPIPGAVIVYSEFKSSARIQPRLVGLT